MVNSLFNTGLPIKPEDPFQSTFKMLNNHEKSIKFPRILCDLRHWIWTRDSELCKNVYGTTALRRVWVWTGFIRFRMETSGRHFWSRYEPSGSIQCGKFLDYWRSISFSWAVDHVFILGVANKNISLGITWICSTTKTINCEGKLKYTQSLFYPFFCFHAPYQFKTPS